MRGLGTLRAAVVFVVAACALAIPATGWAATSWNVASDWVTGANPSGAWSYGWSLSRGSAFNLMTAHNFDPNPGVEDWAAPGGFPHIGHNGSGKLLHYGCCVSPAGGVYFHPGPSGQNAVIRWTAPAAGTYAISASWVGLDLTNATNTAPAVLHNGVVAFSTFVNGQVPQSWMGTVSMAAGDKLDFALGMIYSYYYGSTAAAIQIDRLDSTPPVVTVPAPITAEATAPSGAAVDFTATASDPTGTAGPVTCTAASGSTFPLGTTTVTCSSTDTNGNTGTGSFTITVQDTTPPTVTASLVPLKAGGDDESRQVFRVVFSASDLVGVASLTATLNGVPVTNGQIVVLRVSKKPQKVTTEDGIVRISAGSFTLTVTAADAAGNSATATATPVFNKHGGDDESKSNGDQKSGDGHHQGG